MNINILDRSSRYVAVKAIRKCYQSQEKSDSLWDRDTFVLGENDAARIGSVIDNDHTSTLEHVCYTFEIDGISRTVLQEFARHRIASLSVESSRYCLKRLLCGGQIENVEDSLVFTGVEAVDKCILENMNNVLKMLRENPDITNDYAKYPMPEAFKTNLIWTINIRSLRNFLRLRTSKRALWEIRKLAHAVYAALPETHHIFFKDIMEANNG